MLCTKLFSATPTMSTPEKSPVYGTEDLLISLCNSVTRVLGVATVSYTHLRAHET